MRDELLPALRRLWRTPAATLASIGLLGVGLAAVMLVQLVARELVWQGSSLPTAERLQLLRMEASAGAAHNRLDSWSYPAYLAAREVLAPMATVAVTANPLQLTLQAGEESRRSRTEIVSAGYFEMLGSQPQLGRSLLPSDDVREPAGQQLWLSHALWRDVFAADPDIVGRRLTLEGRDFQVAGVLPPGFRGISEQAELWIPMGAAPAVTFARRLDGRTSFWHQLLVAPADAAEAARLSSRLAVVGARIAEAIELRLDGQPAQIEVQTSGWLQSRVDSRLRHSTLAIAACAGLLLLIVAGNLTLLMLARADARGGELGLRLALGAPRTRLLQGLLAELLLVFGAGLLLAVAGVQTGLHLLAAYQELISVGGQGLGDLRLQLGTLLFGAGLALLALLAVLLGPARALFSLRPGPPNDRQSTRVTAVGRRGLAASQLAFATALAIAAVLAADAARRALQAPLGFAPEGVLSAALSVPAALAPADGMAGLLARMDQAMRELPGVARVGNAYCLPLRGGCDNVLLQTVPPAGSQEWPVQLNMVGGDYFQALGIPLLEGRLLDARDHAQSAPVVVLSAAAARRYFPDGQALGRQVQVGVGWPEQPEGAQVVGIVGDVHDARLEAASEPQLYLPSAQFNYSDVYFLLQASPGSDASLLGQALREALARTEPGLALWDVATMEQRFDRLTARRRFAAAIIGGLAAVAVALAMTGTFAVFDLLVRRRQREYGVRAALGASSRGLQWLVLTQGLRLALLATLLGAAVGIGASRWLAGQLPELGSGGLATGLLVAAAMAALAVLACWWPARRAASVAPMAVLRGD